MRVCEWVFVKNMHRKGREKNVCFATEKNTYSVG